MELGRVVEPEARHAGADVLGGQGEVAGHADARGGLHPFGQECQQFVVAVGGFDEDLCLVVAVDTGFDGFELLEEFVLVDGGIAVEGEVLPVEARGHERQEDAGGAHERHDFDVFAVGHLGDKVAGVGHTGQPGFAHEADVVAFGNGVEVVDDVGFGGVLVEFEEEGVVDRAFVAQGAEVAAGCADVLDDEDAAEGLSW